MPIKLLTLPQAIELTTCSRSYIYSKIKDQNDPFPAPVKLGKKLGFLESEINEWIESKIAKSRETE